MKKNRLYIGNLVFGLTEQELRDFLAPAGRIASMKYQPRNGYAFVEMASEEQAEAAIDKLNQVELKGRPVRIEYDKQEPKPEAPAAEKPADSPKPFYRSHSQGAKKARASDDKPARHDNRPGYADSDVNKPFKDSRPSDKTGRPGKPRRSADGFSPYSRSTERKPNYRKPEFADSSNPAGDEPFKRPLQPHERKGRPDRPYKENRTERKPYKQFSDSASGESRPSYGRGSHTERPARFERGTESPGGEGYTRKPSSRFTRGEPDTERSPASERKPRTYGRPAGDKPRTWGKPTGEAKPRSFGDKPYSGRKPGATGEKKTRDFTPGKPRGGSFTPKAPSKAPRKPRDDDFDY